jgi:hypothetical protein
MAEAAAPHFRRVLAGRALARERITKAWAQGSAEIDERRHHDESAPTLSELLSTASPPPAQTSAQQPVMPFRPASRSSRAASGSRSGSASSGSSSSSGSDSDDAGSAAVLDSVTSLNSSLSTFEQAHIRPLVGPNGRSLRDTLAAVTDEVERAKLLVTLGYVIEDLVWSASVARSLVCLTSSAMALTPWLLAMRSLPQDKGYQPREPPGRARAPADPDLLYQDPGRRQPAETSVPPLSSQAVD